MRVLLAFFLSISCFSFSQSNIDVCTKASKLLEVLKKNHIEPREVNDSLSLAVFHATLDLVDSEYDFFVKDEFDGFRDNLNDLIKKDDCSFVDSLYKLLETRLALNIKFLESLDPSEINFDNDSIKVFENRHETVQEIQSRLVRELKFKTLFDETFGSIEMDTEGLIKRFNRIRLNKIQGFKKLLNYKRGLQAYVADRFLNAIAISFDPHTMYFSSNELKSFLEANASNVLSYGMEFEIDGDYVKISNLVPGGPAWDSGILNIGDIMLAYETKGRIVDLQYYTAMEVFNLMEDSDAKISVKVKKSDGRILDVELIKSYIKSSENIIKSLILEREADVKIAYIILPGFYDAENRLQSNCSDDLAKEILKLKKENVDGIILDIRNNAGGDLEEAIRLAGIFVDRGSLCIYQQTGESPKTIKDPNLGVIFDGPLIIMINGGSASASEILAGTLQDHNRAILIGSKTFGKATGQQIIPLFPEMKNSDFIKCTVMKIFKPSGNSYQKFGIQPDVELPVVRHVESYSEGSLPHALTTSRTSKKAYYYPSKPIKLDSIVQLSQGRVRNSEFFNSIEELNRSEFWERINSKGYWSISYDNSVPVANKRFQEPEVKTSIRLNLNSYDSELISIDTSKAGALEKLKIAVLNDFYIEEAYNVLNDYIKINNE